MLILLLRYIAVYSRLFSQIIFRSYNRIFAINFTITFPYNKFNYQNYYNKFNKYVIKFYSWYLGNISKDNELKVSI